MGTEREGRLLLSLGWPIIVSMLVQALYNIVDSYFVSHLNTLPAETIQRLLGDLYSADAGNVSNSALSALSLVYPLQMLMISVAVGTSVGINSLISRRLGERRIEDANRAAGNGLVLLAISAAAFTVIGLTLSNVYMQWMSTDAIVQRMGSHYMSICLSLCIGVFLSCGIERIMTAQGRTIFAMFMQLTGAIVNIALDRVFVLGFWFVPAMGVKGAAIATVIGQFASMLLAIILLFATKHEIRIGRADYKLNRQTVKEIYRVGLPSILMQAVSTVMLFGMNAVLNALGAYQDGIIPGKIKHPIIYTGAFGTYFKLQSIIFMPVFGLTNAAMSVLGYNFGARNRARFMRAFKMLLIYCCIFMTFGTILFQTCNDPISKIFSSEKQVELIEITDTMTEEERAEAKAENDEKQALAAMEKEAMESTLKRALRIISIGFVFAAAGITFNTAFGATDTSLYGAIVSLQRQLIVLLPVAVLLALITKDVDGIWWAFPISEFITLVVAGLLFKRLYRKKIKPLDDLPVITD